MLFAIAGVSGHTGRAAAEALLSSGARVRVIVRDAAKGEAWAARGAEVAIADLGDARALAEALRGVDGAYLLLPPRVAPGFREYQKATGRSVLAAVEEARPAHVVLLSSVGAQLAEGNGPIAGLHSVEAGLRALNAAHPEVNVTLLRAGYFMENLQGNLGQLDQGLLPVFFPADLGIDMIATHDIGRAGASLLVEGPPAAGTARVVELGGPPTSADDVARELSSLLGRTITAQSAPTHIMGQALQGFGLPADVAGAYQEMTEAMVAGIIRFEGGHRRLFGSTTLRTFLQGVLGR